MMEGLPRLARFAVTGVINTGVDVAVFSFLLTATPVDPFWANLAAFAVAVTGSFVLNRLWTFRDRQTGSPVAFVLWMSAIALVSSWLLASLIAGGLSVLLAKPLTILAVVGASYLAMNKLVFHPARHGVAMAGGMVALTAATALVALLPVS